MDDENNQLANLHGNLQNLFNITDKINGDPVCKSNCKLCNSQYRKDAEEKYLSSQNYLHVYRYLQTKGEDISPNAVKNHLEKHLMKPLLEMRMKDYADDLRVWAKERQTKEQRLENYLVMIDRQIHLLNSNTSETSPDQIRKNTDAVVKLMAQASSIENTLEKYREGMKPIMIFMERFEGIIKEKLEVMQSAEARMALVEILESLDKEVERMNNDE